MLPVAGIQIADYLSDLTVVYTPFHTGRTALGAIGVVAIGGSIVFAWVTLLFFSISPPFTYGRPTTVTLCPCPPHQSE